MNYQTRFGLLCMMGVGVLPSASDWSDAWVWCFMVTLKWWRWWLTCRKHWMGMYVVDWGGGEVFFSLIGRLHGPLKWIIEQCKWGFIVFCFACSFSTCLFQDYCNPKFFCRINLFKYLRLFGHMQCVYRSIMDNISSYASPISWSLSQTFVEIFVPNNKIHLSCSNFMLPPALLAAS